MTRVKIATLVVSAALLSTFTARVSAHHSFAAEFDATKPITLKGAITKIERINPHGWIYMDVKNQDGKVENWAIETGAPTALARAGIRKDSIPIGTEIVVKGYRAKDGSTTANGNIITLPDGRDLSLASSIGNAPGNKPPAGDAR
jgi:Family of unknown function (DUF6152)